ncbi:TolC family protein [Pantoea sp.]|uniref:TolC family protein n=1 Tax=Pantoea sp. TaxID=69393 RepID=UPI0031D4CD05
MKHKKLFPRQLAMLVAMLLLAPAASAADSDFYALPENTSTAMQVDKSSVSSEQLRQIFSGAVQTALQRNPQLLSAQYSAEAAREEVKAAKGARLPQVDVSTGSRRVEFGGGNRGKYGDNNTPAVAVTASTTLYDFGQTSNTIRSKEQGVKAADFQFASQQEDLAWQVSSALVEISKQRLIIEASEEYVARMQKLVNMLSATVQLDAGRRSELAQAKGRFLQAQSALDNAQSNLRDSEITLQRLVGDKRINLPKSRSWNLQPGSVNVLLKQAESHPTLNQARAQAAASLADAEALKASNLPKVNWVVSKSTAKDYYGREDAWQTGVNVSWGVFRGGSASASERAAVQRAEALREEAEENLDDLQQRVRAADQDARSRLGRADLYRNLGVESDQIRKDFFDQWYHLGKRTLLDVLSAESDYYNNRVEEIANRYDGYSAIFRGYAGSGMLLNWLNGRIK